MFHPRAYRDVGSELPIAPEVKLERLRLMVSTTDVPDGTWLYFCSAFAHGLCIQSLGQFSQFVIAGVADLGGASHFANS